MIIAVLLGYFGPKGSIRTLIDLKNKGVHGLQCLQRQLLSPGTDGEINTPLPIILSQDARTTFRGRA
jgi:hypothetical protein